MTTAQFFEKFDLFAGAPDAVAKMRELVVRFALNGEFSVGGRSSWQKVELGELLEVQNGFAFKSQLFNQAGKGLPLIRIRDIAKSSTEVHYSGDYREEFVVSRGDLLIGMDGNFNIHRWKGPAALLNQRVCRLQNISSRLDQQFLFYFVQEHLDEIHRNTTFTTVKHISSKQIKAIRLALPPLAEQKRIVAKVDELMALCDQLEAQQQERETKHTALAQATLARFAEAPTPTNLNLLFHSSFSIHPSDLRKTILTLAVQGKLVPQDPNDEPARSSVPSTTIDSDGLVVLPAAWKWLRVKQTGEVSLGRQRAPQHHKGPHMRPYLRVQNVYEARIDISDVKEMNFTPEEFKTFALKFGDILLNEGQSRELVGRPAIYRDEVPGACFQNTLVRYRAYDCVTAEYALVVFRAYMRNGRFQSISKQTTNIAHLSAGRFAELEFPLPPLGEQKRIVAKVEELMALVDALEAQQAAADQAATHLLDAVVSEMAAAA